MSTVQSLHAPQVASYVSKSCVEQCFKALVFMLVMWLALTKFAYKQVQKQLYYSHTLLSKTEWHTCCSQVSHENQWNTCKWCAYVSS